MKKLYTILASALFAATAATAQVSLPYSSGSMTAAPSATIDVNTWNQLSLEGDNTWSYGSSIMLFELDGVDYRSYYLRLKYGTQNDWLVSPQFRVTPGKQYRITFYASTNDARAIPDEFKLWFFDMSPMNTPELYGDWAEYYESKDITDLPSPVADSEWGTIPAWKKYEFTMTAADDFGSVGWFAFNVKTAEKASSGPIAIANVTIEEVGGEGGGEEPEQPEVPAGKAVPYESTIAVSSSAFDDGWTFINANNDSYTWTPQTEYSTDHSMSGLYAQCRYSSSLASDDFLSSPAIHLEGGKEYKVMYGYRTYNTSNKEHMTVYASESVADADAIKAGVMVADYDDNAEEKWSTTPNVWKRYASTFVPETTGDYYISFHACSEKNKYYVYVSDFAVVENTFAPAGVSGFTATAAEGRALECNLAWTLPTKSIFDDPFTAEQTVESVTIFRDGGETPIATLTGAVTEFTDTEATGLTSGYHTYAVKVTVAGVESSAVEAKSRYVGPVAPVDIPAEFKLTSANDFDLYTTLYGPAYSPTDDTNVWRTTSGNQIELRAGSATVEDSWLIAPPVTVAEAGYYRVTLSARVSYTGSGYSHKFEYCVGNDDTIEAMEVRSTDIGLTSSLSDHYFDFYAPEPGVYYIGIHACDNKSAQGTYGNTFSLASIKVAASKRLPAAVTDLKAVPAADESLNIEVSWTNPAVSFAGDAMSRDEYKVLVYLGDELALTLEGEQLTEGTQTVTVPVAETGVYTVKVQTVALDADASTVDMHPSATTSWVGPRTVALPYAIDFTVENPSAMLWEMVDGNADGKTWSFVTTGYSDKGAKLNGSTSVDGLYSYDDFLISPILELTPGNYRFTVNAKGGSSYAGKFYFNLGAFKAGAFNADKSTWLASQQYGMESYSYADADFDFTVEEAGRYQVVIAADEAFTKNMDYYSLVVKTANIKAIVALPGIATDVTVTPGADFALEAIIGWTNPTETSFEGVMLAEGDITKAVIYRNGVEVGTVEEGLVPGLEATFTDTTVPTGGAYTYKVEVYTANGCSETAATEVKSTWIGPGLEVPEIGLNYGADWEDGPFTGWTIVDNNSSNKVLAVNWTYGLGITSNSITPDCFAYSRPIQFEKDNIYRIVIDSHYDYDVLGEVTPELHYGQSEDVAEFVKIGEWSIPETATNRNKRHTETFYIYAVDASELAAQAEEAGEGEEGSGDDELISKSVKVPAGALRLALRANDKGSYYFRNVEIKHEKSVTGVDDVKVADGVMFSANGIFFDGEAAVEVYSLTGMLVAADAHAVDSFDLSTLAKGVYVVRITPANGKTVTLKIVK